MTSFTLFGTLQATAATRTLGSRDFGGRKPKQLLEILLLQEGRFVAKDQLADLLWGEKLPVNFASTVEHYVSLVRKRLNPGGRPQESLLVTGHGGYRIDNGRAWLDITAFTELADRATTLPQLEQAIGLASAELLEDEPYADWAMKARGYYGQRYQRLVIAAAQAALAGGNMPKATEYATTAVRADSLAEDGYRLLMTAHYGAGNQQEALLTYRTCQRILRDEAGLEPMRETSALHEAILARAPLSALLPGPGDAVAPVVVTAAPASGSLPLVGRSGELAQLTALCSGTAAPSGAAAATGLAVAIVDGETGAGKTRLLDELAGTIAGRHVVRIRCAQFESDLRGALLGDVVRALSSDPSVTELVLDTFTTADPSAGGARAIVLEALCSLLRQRPVVLLVDDAHWADPESVAILASAARRLDGPSSGALIFACRTGGHRALARLEPAARLTLWPLTAADLDGLAGPGGIDGADLAEHTGGLPLYVAGWLAEPSNLRELVLTRSAELGPDLFRTAAVAAWLPQPCGPEELARVLGIQPLPAVDRLEELSDSGMLRAAGRGFEFRYPVVRDTLAGTMSAARQRVLGGLVRSAESTADRRSEVAAFPPVRERRDQAGDRRNRIASHPASIRQPLYLAAGTA
ncbi:MAG: embR [Actinomycetia bacterium]|nr:embR [Actinomycetes bacterium]